jgi:itaconate CoA-transferase
VSLFSAMAEWMTIPILFRQYADIEWPRVGLTHPNISPYRPFVTSDGVQTLFAIQSDREFRRLCAMVLGRPEWADHPDYATNMARNANRVALEASISEILARISAPQLTALLDRAEIAYARVSTVSDMAVHPQLQRSAIATEQGVDVSVPALAADFDERPAHMGRVPKLGQHTEQIRKEFGA